MAVDKLVDSTQLDADLTSVANAIRTKGGTSAQLAFPTGFVNAIDAIPTGGGSDSEMFLVRGGSNVYAFSGHFDGTQAIYDIGSLYRASIWCVSKTAVPAIFQFGNAKIGTLRSGLYPVPIPNGATRVQFSTTKGGQYDLFFVHMDNTDGPYVIDSTSGWVNVDNNFVEIPQGATHIVSMHRVNEDNTGYSYTTFPYDAKLLFE